MRMNFILYGLLSILLISNAYALPFSIVPKTPLPISVPLGGIVYAYYTVSNNTSAERNSNYVAYLPRNALQVTGGGTYSDTCGVTFDLAGNGRPGSSCTLQLIVSGPISASDPSPSNHLFVCFPGNKTCAGTNFPLNVKQG